MDGSHTIRLRIFPIFVSHRPPRSTGDLLGRTSPAAISSSAQQAIAYPADTSSLTRLYVVAHNYFVLQTINQAILEAGQL